MKPRMSCEGFGAKKRSDSELESGTALDLTAASATLGDQPRAAMDITLSRHELDRGRCHQRASGRGDVGFPHQPRCRGPRGRSPNGWPLGRLHLALGRPHLAVGEGDVERGASAVTRRSSSGMRGGCRSACSISGIRGGRATCTPPRARTSPLIHSRRSSCYPRVSRSPRSPGRWSRTGSSSSRRSQLRACLHGASVSRWASGRSARGWAGSLGVVSDRRPPHGVRPLHAPPACGLVACGIDPRTPADTASRSGVRSSSVSSSGVPPDRPPGHGLHPARGAGRSTSTQSPAGGAGKPP